MDRRNFTRIGFGLAAGGTLVAATARAADDGKAGAKGKAHRVAIQVSSEEHKVQELALGNAHNFAAYYEAKGEPYRIELVAFGPGYNMMRDDISMVKGNIENLKQELGEHITFAACQNSRDAVAASMGQKPEQIPQIKEATNVPSGIVRLTELQEQGWAYIRP